MSICVLSVRLCMGGKLNAFIRSTTKFCCGVSLYSNRSFGCLLSLSFFFIAFLHSLFKYLRRDVAIDKKTKRLKTNTHYYRNRERNRKESKQRKINEHLLVVPIMIAPTVFTFEVAAKIIIKILSQELFLMKSNIGDNNMKYIFHR